MKNTAKLIAVLIFLLVADLIWLWYITVRPVDSVANREVEFTVVKGQPTTRIAHALYAEGLIHSPFVFQVHTMLQGASHALQAGEYLLRTSMSMPEIIQRLSGGEFIKRELVVPEGADLKDIAALLEEQGLFSQNDFFAVAGAPGLDYRETPNAPMPHDFSDEFAFLAEKPVYVSLEGYLFPDTYQIAKGDTPHDIVRRMLRNFETQLTQEIIQETKQQEKSLFEILTMASIIEKEVRSYEDKQIVSGVLWKRLADDMRLQVDATVVYVREGNYYKVTFEELEIDSPYNTYENHGLPPGPISNPGIESIKTALYPVESPYWFYLSPSANTTVFSRTFEEHKAAANLYIR